MDARSRLIFALDVPTFEEAVNLVKELAPYVGIFKIGLEAMTGIGTPKLVEAIHKSGRGVFLDGKFNDIPKTIERASKAAADLGIELFNVHASSGPEAIRMASAVKGKSKLLAVTVLTSMTAKDSIEIFGSAPEKKVTSFAEMALKNGADGIICSAQELSNLRSFSEALKVVPGIRPTWADANDQKRTMTPKEAVQAGATHLVVGRPIQSPPTNVGSRVKAASLVLKEIEEGLS